MLKSNHACAALLLLFALFICHIQASRDPYQVLGVSTAATAKQIKKAFHKLALQYHPDKNPSPAAHQKFVEIQEAYETLSDEDKRKEYDERGSNYQRGFHHEGYSRGFREGSHGGFSFGNGRWHGWQDQQQYEHMLPSQTTALTSSNIRLTVFASSLPWLIMIYSHQSEACKAAAAQWEAAYKASGREGWGGLGRIHWHTQQLLVQRIAQGTSLFGFPINIYELPVVVGRPPSCRDFSCLIRHTGPITTTALSDFLAEELLQLPVIPEVLPTTLDIWLARVPAHKVAALALSSRPGGGSLRLRKLAQQHGSMVAFGRAHYKEEDAAFWLEQLGVAGAPAVVFFKGPGTQPSVVHQPPGSRLDLGRLLGQEGHAWQVVPQLSGLTDAALGCRPSPDAAGQVSELCVVLVGHAGEGLRQGRANMAALAQLLLLQQQRSSSRAAQLYVQGKLRLAWVEAAQQLPFCGFHFGHGSRAGFCAAGSWLSWRAWWGAVRSAAGMPGARPPAQEAYVVAYRTLSFPAGILRRTQRQYLWAANTALNLAEPQGSETLQRLADWLDQLMAGAGQPAFAMKSNRWPDFDATVREEEPAALDFVAAWVAKGLRVLEEAFRGFVMGRVEHSVRPVIPVALFVVMMVVMQLVFRLAVKVEDREEADRRLRALRRHGFGGHRVANGHGVRYMRRRGLRHAREGDGMVADGDDDDSGSESGVVRGVAEQVGG